VTIIIGMCAVSGLKNHLENKLSFTYMEVDLEK
jgi:hypothetical protein